jgi:bifunctional DNA-binding transcriptional regulator/antitoxin component of YhaV-PrlF toxin-antitoxin module
MMTSIVTGKRQLTVPAKIARILSIDTGTKVEWLEGNKPDEVILKVKPSRSQLLDRLEKISSKYRGRGPDSSVVLDQERELADRNTPDESRVAEERTTYKAVSRRRKK